MYYGIISRMYVIIMQWRWAAANHPVCAMCPNTRLGATVIECAIGVLEQQRGGEKVRGGTGASS